MEHAATTTRLIPLAQAVGLSASAFLTGYIGSFSYVAVPVISIASSADLLARQWKLGYDIGATSAPPVSILVALANGFLAWKSHGAISRRISGLPDFVSPFVLYTSAAMAAASIAPYTIFVMDSTNTKLKYKAAQPHSMSDQDTKQLVQKWKGMSYNRAILSAISTICGALAIFG